MRVDNKKMMVSMFRKLTLLALLMALILGLLGTWDRTSGAASGCTDLFTCGDAFSIGSMDIRLGPNWKGTAHRHLAAVLGGLVLLMSVGVFAVANPRGRAIALTCGVLLLLVGQVMLGVGMLKFHLMPMMVSAHLLLGSLTLYLIQRLYLTVKPPAAPMAPVAGAKWLSRLGLLLLFIQIGLGGWVSSNYAGMVCPDVPMCLGSWWPEADYAGAMSGLKNPAHYQGQLLPPAALVAVQIMHRVGAAVLFLVLTALAMVVTSNRKVPGLSKAGLLLSFLLLVQIGLGVGLIRLHLPTPMVLAHTLVSSLLLLNVAYIGFVLGLPQASRPSEVDRVLDEPPQPNLVHPTAAPRVGEIPEAPPAAERLLNRLKGQLGKTRTGLTGFLSDLALGRKTIDRDLLDDIEAQLLMADIGVSATQDIIAHLTESLERHQLDDVAVLRDRLRQYLLDIIEPVSAPLQIPPETRPFVILVVGVNGVGKTTTIGKLAKRFQNRGHTVMLAAGDTFRAAAVEQLQAWGERNNVPVVAQHTGADSASVIYDAVQAAQARGVDVLIADTAGRLHNKSNLMDELGKIKRIMARLDETAPHEVLLVLDAGTGQNAINQARQFNEAVGLTGLALTKLDGTAKGGVIFALAKQFGVPVRFIGIGEGIDDLQDFDARQFIGALFDDQQTGTEAGAASDAPL